jgi:hypothetical protein
LETINKLITGLDRTAADLGMIVEYGQPLVLNKQAGVDLDKILREVAVTLNDRPPVSGILQGSIVVEAEPAQLVGEFDAVLLAGALKAISLSAMKMLTTKMPEALLEIHLKGEGSGNTRNGVIEWRVADSSDHDPFHSFAGSNEIRLSLAARIIEAHGGSAQRLNGDLCVRLPLAQEAGTTANLGNK